MKDNTRNNFNKFKKFNNSGINEDNEIRDFKSRNNKFSSNKNFKNDSKFNNGNFNKNKDFRGKSNKKQTEKEDQFALQKAKNYEDELEKMKERIGQETPPCGYYYFNKADFNFSDSESDLEDDENEEPSNTLNKNESSNENNKNNENLEEMPKQKNLWKREKFYFKDLAISRKTLKGLSESKFIKMTPVQRYTLPHSLAGRDILGASKTGSGKTLSFIIPVLECLYRQKWTSLDGLGALLILPTRELAMQVFEVFRLVGKYHDFSIGLVIGGNNLEEEKSSLYKINILIGTPGRLSQHFTETANFNTDNVQLLCIDEADRILDEGFEEALTEIISYLPSKKRQTLLFSATLSRDLKRMAKVSLKSPEYINVSNTDAFLSMKAEIVDNDDSNANKNLNNNNNRNLHMDKINLNLNSNPDTNNDNNDKNTDLNNTYSNNNDLTPINLNQFYNVCETHEKLDILFSFLKSHKNAKCLVFLSSCKQVRYYTEIFRRLKLGMTFLDLHGKQKQGKRTNIFYTFLNKKNSVLFATDIASRGVDFPQVDWVIQLDCPEDISTYIHRVGRTARYKSKGNSLLLVNKKEEKLVEILQNKKVNIKKIKINTSKVVGLQPILRSLISENSDLIHLAQKAIKSYLKSVYLQSKKDIFDIKAIDVQQLALSYGLVNLPEVKISRRSENDLKNLKKNLVNGKDNESDEDSSDLEVEEEDAEFFQGKASDKNRKKSKLQKLKEKIAEKKQIKTKELNDIMMNENVNLIVKKEENEKKEENTFLKLKRKSDKNTNDNDINKNDKLIKDQVNNDEEERIKIENNKTDEKQIKNNKNEIGKKNDFYEKLKAKLVLNEDEDKIKEKARIHDKHRADRLKRKEFDYEKHGLNEESGEEEEFNEEEDEDQNKFGKNKSYSEDLDLKEEKVEKNNVNAKSKKTKKNEYIDSDGETYNFKFIEDKKLLKNNEKEKSKSIIKKGILFFLLNLMFF